MSAPGPVCAHCQSTQVRQFRSTEKAIRSFLTPDIGFWTWAIRRNTSGGRPILPLLCESCQRHSFPCPNSECGKCWPVEALPKLFTTLACPECGRRVQYQPLFK